MEVRTVRWGVWWGVFLVGAFLIWVALPRSDLPPGDTVDGVPVAPACDEPRLSGLAVSTYLTHPNYPHTPPVQEVVDAREVGFERHVIDGDSASTRYCSAAARYADGTEGAVWWDMFATRTILGVAWGFRVCFEGHDLRDPTCGFARQ